MARRPSAGFGSGSYGASAKTFSPPRSKRADGDLAVAHLVEDVAVGAVVVLFAGRLGAAEEEELGAVQADGLAAAAEHRGDLVRQLDVAGDDDVVAVERARRQRLGLEQVEVHDAVVLGALAALLELRARRPQHHRAVAAVDDHQVARAGGVDDAVHADDRRHLERAGDDGGVRGLAADLGDEGGDAMARQQRRVGRATGRAPR